MTTTAVLLKNCRISIRFPAEFQVSGIQFGEQGSPPGLLTKLSIDRNPVAPCGTDCQGSPETVNLIYNDAADLPAYSIIVLAFKNLKNRRWAGTTDRSNYECSTRTEPSP